MHVALAHGAVGEADGGRVREAAAARGRASRVVTGSLPAAPALQTRLPGA
jgi:hypothetical protein